MTKKKTEGSKMSKLFENAKTNLYMQDLNSEEAIKSYFMRNLRKQKLVKLSLR
jgi:hypothetical protein